MNGIKTIDDLRDELLTILDSVSDYVIIFDPEARIVWVNQTVCDTLNITKEKILGKTQKQVVEEGYWKGRVVYEAIRAKKEVAGIITAGNEMEVMTRTRPVLDRDGNIRYLVSTSTSLKELNDLRVNLEKERRESKKYLREIEHLRKILLIDENFIFESPEMKTLVEDVMKVAPFDYTVLISGESGVGKEVVAKIIHMNSPRKNGPFIPVCIPAIPESLLESELFGYEGGAFTGSFQGGKTGLFEVAQGGTLFLDEIGDVPPDVQVKILRAIENGEIRRVGGIKNINMDVRIIAATNRDLGQMIKKGLFREDLYYRLSVVPLHVKPLRERLVDILPLCNHFIKAINTKYNKNKEISKPALEILMSHTWPGNVRELKNIVERLTALSNGNLITPDDVKTVFHNIIINIQEKEKYCERTPDREYDAFEKAKIFEALKQAGGNKKKASEILGISRNKLYRRLAKYKSEAPI